MSAIPQRQETFESTGMPPQPPDDYYAALVNVVTEAANDPARVRNLVYAVARSNVDPEILLAPALPEAIWQARTLDELDQAFRIERAIQRIEERTAECRAAPDWPITAWPTDDADPAPKPAVSAVEPFPGSEPIKPAPEPLPVHAALSALEKVARELPAGPAQPAPAQHPAWFVAVPEVRPTPLTRGQRLRSAWAALPTSIHVAATALIAAILLVGISGALQGGIRTAAETADAKTAPPGISVALKSAKNAKLAKIAKLADTVEQTPGPIADDAAAATPMPVPHDVGVYATQEGLFTQLEPLPVAIAAAGTQASAEITQSSRTTLSGDRLSFVVLDRDFVQSAPQTVLARVIGRVSQTVQYVGGRLRVTKIAGPWHLRDKTYAFKVTPLEDRDMLVIRPDAGAVLPAGRYALVLNGRGYDFTVAGPVTAPEQCLKQAMNGVIVGDCTDIQPRAAD